MLHRQPRASKHFSAQTTEAMAHSGKQEWLVIQRKCPSIESLETVTWHWRTLRGLISIRCWEKCERKERLMHKYTRRWRVIWAKPKRQRSNHVPSQRQPSKSWSQPVLSKSAILFMRPPQWTMVVCSQLKQTFRLSSSRDQKLLRLHSSVVNFMKQVYIVPRPNLAFLPIGTHD